MSDKTPTERMRDGLTARGVEWWSMHGVGGEYYEDRDTEFVIDGRKYTAHEWGSSLTVWGLTPEQAIAATVGAGTCHSQTDSRWEAAVRDLENAKAENAKLRELVRDALTTISWCTIDCYPSDNKKRELSERARELGVEVDG